MGNAMLQPIEDSVIDETFKGLASPSEIHRMGREDITEGRPGDILVAEVIQFASEGNFAKLAERKNANAAPVDGVKVSQKSGKRITLSAAEELALAATSEDRNELKD